MPKGPRGSGRDLIVNRHWDETIIKDSAEQVRLGAGFIPINIFEPERSAKAYCLRST